LPPASRLLAALAGGGVLVGGAYAIHSLGTLLTSSSDRWSATVGLVLGLLFVIGCGHYSWPALVRKRLRAKVGRLSTEWALPIGPAFWTRKDATVTRLIVRQGKWRTVVRQGRRKTEGSTDQVVIEHGARRHIAETVMNLPEYSSFRWLNNWKVAGSSPSLKSNPTKPWLSVSPVVLALAGQLAHALGVPVYFEIGAGRAPLFTFGDD
jgi:hypothetical protein